MTNAERPTPDPLVELGYALAEGDSAEPSGGLRDRVISAAAALRAPGRPAVPAPAMSGSEVFGRMVGRLDTLLGQLLPQEWARPALRDLDVQGLVGHLIAIEGQFERALGQPGSGGESDDHVGSTQPIALAQSGRPTADTHHDWRDATRRTLDAVHRSHDHGLVAFYGVTMPLDALLVVRAFEMWTHDEDIRRATARPLPPLEPGQLARMTELAVQLLPAGMARAGRALPGTAARLVLTGPGGGTF